MSSSTTHYETLGVAPSATPEDIKAAYRALAMEHHPDRNGGSKASEEKFKLISVAYQVLSDPEKRRRYDLVGNGVDTTTESPFHHSDEDFERMIREHIRETIGQEHGFGGRRVHNRVHGHLNLSLADVLHGKQAMVDVAIDVACETCLGECVDTTKKDMVPCSLCGGQGKTTVELPLPGRPRGVSMCMRCHGRGRSYPPCPTCEGAGSKAVKTTVPVKIPRGIPKGAHIQVPVPGQRTGVTALIATTTVIPGGMEVDGRGNVLQHVFLDYPTAVLGGSLGVITFEGTTAQVKIPEGLPSRNLRLKEKGLPVQVHSEARGDLLLVVEVAVPTKVTEEEKALLEKLKALQK